MGRWRDAWRALLGSEASRELSEAELDERYVRRDELTDVLQQVVEAEVALAALWDRLGTLAARWRKREQRAAEAAAEIEPPQQGQLQLHTGGKAELRARAAAVIAQRRGGGA